MPVHSRLRESLESCDLWAAGGISFEFADPAALFLLRAEDIPVLVPAASEPDRELVRSLRRSRCLAPILAVVNDITGHQTFLAIKAGASGVLNIRLTQDKQVDAVLTACTATARLLPRGPRLGDDEDVVDVVAEWDSGPAGTAEPQRTDPEEAARLTRMLCGTSSISSIAQQFYCSERSMYRRIRRLYQHIGVSGRSELRARMAGAHAVAIRYERHRC